LLFTRWLLITEVSKLLEPARSETPQELRRATRHVGFSDDVCFNSNLCPVLSFFHGDRPLRCKPSIPRLGQVSNQHGRIVLPYYVSAGHHNRVVQLPHKRTSFCPRRSLPLQVRIQVGELRPVFDVSEQFPDTIAGESCADGIGKRNGQSALSCKA